MDRSAQSAKLRLVDAGGLDAAQSGHLDARLESLGHAGFACDRWSNPGAGGGWGRRWCNARNNPDPYRSIRISCLAAADCRAYCPPWPDADSGGCNDDSDPGGAICGRAKRRACARHLVPLRHWCIADPICVCARDSTACLVDRANPASGAGRLHRQRAGTRLQQISNLS